MATTVRSILHALRARDQRLVLRARRRGEYPGWRTKLIVYSMATTVSFSRVLARQHFPSDVIVGSTFGYLIEGLVFHQRLPEWTGFRFSSIQTPNGKGFQISYDFNRHRGE